MSDMYTFKVSVDCRKIKCNILFERLGRSYFTQIRSDVPWLLSLCRKNCSRTVTLINIDISSHLIRCAQTLKDTQRYIRHLSEPQLWYQNSYMAGTLSSLTPCRCVSSEQRTSTQTGVRLQIVAEIKRCEYSTCQTCSVLRAPPKGSCTDCTTTQAEPRLTVETQTLQRLLIPDESPCGRFYRDYSEMIFPQ